MQIVFLFLLACIISSAVVFETQMLTEKRSGKRNLLLMSAGVVLCLIFSILAEFVITAKRPSFYYHTHTLGPANIKLFAAACFSGGCFYALMLLFAGRKKRKNAHVYRLIISFLAGICGMLLLEIGFFNFRHFELINSGAPEITIYQTDIPAHGLYFNRASWKFHPFSWTMDHKIFLYPNSKIRNIHLPFDDGNQRLLVQIGFDDSAHRGYEFIPDHELVSDIPRSLTIPLHTVGKTYSMEIDLPNIKNYEEIPNYGIGFPDLRFNYPVPLEIHPVRCALVFLALFLITALFPGSPLWMIPLDFRSFPQMAAIFGLLCLFFTVFVWTVFSSYTGSDLSISEQKNALNENSQQYYKLVDALLASRYALLETPHRYLDQLQDPYDMRQREGKQFGYLWDTAYYKGSYYVYFGVVPAVAVLLPYRVLIGTDLELDYPILGFCVVFVLGLYGIYAWIVKRYFQNISFALYWTGALLLTASLNLTWCLRRTLVYELAITSGICFAVWAIYFMLLAESSSKRRLFLFLSGSFGALAIGCRPTMVFASLVLCTVMFCGFRYKELNVQRRPLFDICLFLIPYVLVGLALMKYNYERFDDPFEFGITYQLTTENRAAGIPLLGFYGRLLSVFSSLFTFPSVDLNFPFIHLQVPDLPYNGVILNSDTVLGFFAYPIMAFLILIPVFCRRLNGKSRMLLPFIGSCLAAAAGICITASSFAVANRYLTDYLYLAAIPAVIALFCFCEKCKSVNWHEMGQTSAFICAVISVCLFASVSMMGEDNWFQKINPLYFERLKYAFSPWL